MKGKSSASDRRSQPRIPIVDGLMEPINLDFDGSDGQSNSVPAIITDLSAGGICMVTFSEPPRARQFEIDLHLPGLRHIPVSAKVLWVHTKGETYMVGMAFVKISKKDLQYLESMSQDYMDCETRIELSLPEACVPDCHFHRLCKKPQKAPHWPPKA